MNNTHSRLSDATLAKYPTNCVFWKQVATIAAVGEASVPHGAIMQHSVPVRGRLVGPLGLDADVLGLVVRKHGELCSEMTKVEAGDLLVEVLGEDVDLALFVLIRVTLGPQLELGEGLVGEGGRHDEGGVTSGAAEVEEAALSEDDDAAASVGELESVDLGLDVLANDAGEGLEAGHVDLVVKVTDVADNGVVLHLVHRGDSDDVLVACGGDEDVGLGDDRLEPHDAEALHAGLQCADGVNLSDVDDATGGLEGLGASLADVAEPSNDCALAGEHDIGGAHQAVREGVLAAVEVVELGLGDGVVDVDGAEEESALLGHCVETVHTGGGLLRDTDAAGSNGAPLPGMLGKLTADDCEDNLELGVCGRLGVGESAVLLKGLLGLDTLVDEQGHITTVVNDDVHAGALAVVGLPGDCVESAFPILLEGLALPGEHGRGAGGRHGSSGVVLSGEDVARAPAEIGAEVRESLDENSSLHGHVQRARDARTSEGLGITMLRTGGHEAGHLDFGEIDLLAAEISEGNVLDLGAGA